ncbi:enoyl-[acyl-carrier-protein] reductase [NADPH] FabL-like [Ptychodera flava]|uniref:enoyl-[acyl-carrier-protein] reductase [NADPH] FabL-like n=1 Tax=Ptychodera flava TaxID=63121 RepID=UPI003969FDA4
MEGERKTAVVTGGTRGIGLGISKILARDGYNLILGYNSNVERAQKAQSYLEEEYGAAVIVVKGDVCREETIAALFDAVEKHFDGRLHALVHNAGLYVGKSTTPSSDDARVAADEKLSLNTEQPLGAGSPENFAQLDYYQKVYPKCFSRCVEKSLQHFEKSGEGHIICISSPGCNITQPPRVGYDMPGQAKTVMEFLTRYYAIQLAPKRINVNCVIPGVTRSEAWGKVPLENLASKICPMDEVIAPEEIGEAVSFLCKPTSRFITGVSLPVDGGLYLKV